MRFRSIVVVLTVVIVVIGGLVSFTQCGKADRALLTRADSLLEVEEGDSAMMILQSIDSTDLSSSNNAYYALLYTQAQYKCYVPITSDSLINIAVRYYTNNYDQRKLTKALMYRGAVYADLNFRRQALDSYKEAEKAADTSDWQTLGLLNFRIGELYHNSYIENSEPIERYKKAANCFRAVGHESFENYSYGYLGKMYITENYDSAYYYITKTIDWAIEQGGQEQLLNASRVDLSKLYWHYGVNLDKRKELLLNVYRDRDLIVIGADVLNHLVDTYCKLGMIDSAKYYAAQFAQPEQLVDSMSYNMMLESLAIAQGDYKTAYNSNLIATKVADKIMTQGKAEEYYAIDKQYDNTVANAKVENLGKQRIIHLTIIVIVVLLFIVFTYVVWNYRKHKELTLIEQQRTIDQLRAEMDRKSSSEDMLNRNISVIENLDKSDIEKRHLETALKEIIEQRMVVMRELLNISHLHESQPVKFLDQFNKIVSVNKKSQKECEELVNIANQMYDNIIVYLTSKYTNLNYEDSLVLCLVCFEFTPVEMKVYFNLPTMQAIYSIRNRVNKKVGAISLDTFIAQVKQFLVENRG